MLKDHDKCFCQMFPKEVLGCERLVVAFQTFNLKQIQAKSNWNSCNVFTMLTGSPKCLRYVRATIKHSNFQRIISTFQTCGFPKYQNIGNHFQSNYWDRLPGRKSKCGMKYEEKFMKNCISNHRELIVFLLFIISFVCYVSNSDLS